MSAEKDVTYNGWANWETWNVALWIANDEGLYQLARDSRWRYEGTRRGCLSGAYERFVAAVKEWGGEIAVQTPDGAKWDDPCLDTDALDAMLEEL